AGILDGATGNVDGSAEILRGDAVELERGSDRDIPIAKHHDPSGRTGLRGSQIERAIAVDRGSRVIIAVVRCKDQRHSGSGQRGSAAQAEIAAVEVIDARIERDGRAGIVGHPAAVDPGLIVTASLALKLLSVQAPTGGDASSLFRSVVNPLALGVPRSGVRPSPPGGAAPTPPTTPAGH